MNINYDNLQRHVSEVAVEADLGLFVRSPSENLPSHAVVVYNKSNNHRVIAIEHFDSEDFCQVHAFFNNEPFAQSSIPLADIPEYLQRIQAASSTGATAQLYQPFRDVLGTIAGLFDAHPSLKMLPPMFQIIMEQQIAVMVSYLTLSGPRYTIAINELNQTPITLEQSIHMSPMIMVGNDQLPIPLDPSVTIEEGPTTTALFLIRDEFVQMHRMLTALTALSTGTDLPEYLNDMTYVNVFTGTLFDSFHSMMEGDA